MEIFVVNIRAVVLGLAVAGARGFCAENPGTPKKEVAPPGPLVDVMMDDGALLKGYLLSYSGGQISLRLESGEVVTGSGEKVRTVRFFGATPATGIVAPAAASAQETELTPSEVQKIFDFRRRQTKGVINKFTKEIVREAKELTKEEEKEFLLLRAKLDLHLKALEREIKNVDNEERAMKHLFDFARSQFQYGTTPDYIRPLVDQAADSIANPAVKTKVLARSKELTDQIEDRFRIKNPKKLP